MNIGEIIEKWYALARGDDVERDDVFFRFVALWVAFNALYASQNSGDYGDWDQVRAFAGEPEIIDRHRLLLRGNEKYKRAVLVLKERGVYDVATRRQRTISNAENLSQVISCIYQVRCNLFHGGKMPGNPRDEKLVQASYDLAALLLEPFLTNPAIRQ